MKKYHFLTYLAISLIFFSCGNEKKNAEPEIKTVETINGKEVYTATRIKAKFKDANVTRVYYQYINLKTALVNTNSKDASYASLQLMEALSSIGVINSQAVRAIMASKNIEEQRKSFVKVTAFMEEILEDALESGTIYKQYCPMAFNNTGAFWLSNTKEIQNPYFGDKMLKCGRIDSEIK